MIMICEKSLETVLSIKGDPFGPSKNTDTLLVLLGEEEGSGSLIRTPGGPLVVLEGKNM